MDEPPAHVSKRMRAVRTSGTALELAVRKLIWNMGFRYRTNVTTLPGKPDLANKKQGWAIFVNGCMWHGHACAKSRQPKINTAFWREKIKANRRRDARNRNQLREAGIAVLTIWQCELRRHSITERKIRAFFKGKA
jgi:DNA mismatch endonuclease (patch repair protein)